MSAESASNHPTLHQAPPLRCDGCSNPIISDNSHAQNNPCGHIVCFPCVLKANMKWLANPAFCQVRDCSQKFITSCQYFNRGMPGEIIEIETIAELGTDVIPRILSFLPLEKIMCLRLVNTTWRDAAKKTIVPPTDFVVEEVKKYRAMRVMARVLPNLQRITIGPLGGDGHRWSLGEDSDAGRAASTAHYTTHDIETISSFTKLRTLNIGKYAGLSGRYPFLFNFPLLQKLSIDTCYRLKWDLEMLAELPLLKELDCVENRCLTGNISSLSVLKDTLEEARIRNCRNVEGNFMDLADFPHLKELDLEYTAVTGDIRDIGNNDFSSLEKLILPHGVYGGQGSKFQRIADGADLVRAVYLFQKQRPMIKLWLKHWYAILSEDSRDWYDSADDDDDTPPFIICFVGAGSRHGYRWETNHERPCEVNWLDPEPESDSREYEDYVADYSRIQGEISRLYRGYYEPPTEEQYILLYEEYLAEIQGDDDEVMND